MKETFRSQLTDTVIGKRFAPKGIGMAVAFDWGLTVELLLIPIAHHLTADCLETEQA